MAMARDGAVGPVALGSAILAALGCLALVLCAGGEPDRLA
jgi:hypothetical protein